MALPMALPKKQCDNDAVSGMNGFIGGTTSGNLPFRITRKALCSERFSMELQKLPRNPSIF